MWSAALPCRRTGLVLLGSILTAAVVFATPSGSAAPAAAPGQVWALALPNSVRTVEQRQLDWLASNGVTTLVAFGRTQTSLQRLAVAANRSRLTVIAPARVPPKKACSSAGNALVRCAVTAGTPTAAVRLARRGIVDYVVIRVRTPVQLRMLRGSRAKRTRIVALLPLSQKAAARAAWRAGVAYAAADPALELGVSSAPTARAPLSGYLAQLPRTRAAAAAGPEAPSALLVTARTVSTVTLRWTASPGTVAGYGVYTDGAFVLNVDAVSITLTALQCGRTYTFSVDAYDEGARSAPISVAGATDSCPSGGSGGGQRRRRRRRQGAARPTSSRPRPRSG